MLVDVREPNEYKGGFIPNALNIPLSQIKGRIGEFTKDKEVYLYCRSGMRSKQAARILHKNGISNLANLQGGISAWNGKITK
ncbi:MAG: rhodanese-like domain-containing protein [Paenibacillaceae bacterium]